MVNICVSFKGQWPRVDPLNVYIDLKGTAYDLFPSFLLALNPDSS